MSETNSVQAADILAYYKVLRRGQRKTPGPNLIGVGPGRSGTSFLYEVLDQSRDIYFAPHKELNFFGVFEVGNPNNKKKRGGWTYDDYERLFMLAGEERYIAEVTPIYLEHPGSLEGIARYNPEMKIIITLREPLERVMSQFRHQANRNGYESFDQYVRDGIQQVSQSKLKATDWYAPGKNIKQSLYAEDVARAYRLFDPSNVCVLIYEDLVSDPQIWIRQISEFLDLDLGSLDVDRRVNASRSAIEQQLSPETHSRCQELFLDDIRKTADLLNVDLMAKWHGRALGL